MFLQKAEALVKESKGKGQEQMEEAEMMLSKAMCV
jgi:hypothetical protein